jgi:hypothetical protein
MFRWRIEFRLIVHVWMCICLQRCHLLLYLPTACPSMMVWLVPIQFSFGFGFVFHLSVFVGLFECSVGYSNFGCVCGCVIAANWLASLWDRMLDLWMRTLHIYENIRGVC